MRVIAGEAKGRKLHSLKGTETRPTLDKVREALFASVGGRISKARVLDLYAGSGALGIEALSRGAAFATFVEKNRQAVAVIRRNLEETRLAGSSEVLHLSAEDFLARPPLDSYNLVLIDPPYSLGFPEKPLQLLLERYLSEDALVVVEISSRIEVEGLDGYSIMNTKRYGDTTLVFMNVVESH